MRKEEIIEIFRLLKKEYPDATCSLDFATPFEMMIAVMLSAQCTDERVNKVTKEFFPLYHTPADFADMPLEQIENLIHSCGFYHNKAKNMKLASQKVLKDFNGEIPQTMEELMTIPGVGRKSANVILLEVFGIAKGIAVDTHAKRLSNRIGLSKQNDPEKIEQDLLKIFPHKYLKEINHLFIWHGRNTCMARGAKCDNCTIRQYCKNKVS